MESRRWTCWWPLFLLVALEAVFHALLPLASDDYVYGALPRQGWPAWWASHVHEYLHWNGRLAVPVLKVLLLADVWAWRVLNPLAIGLFATLCAWYAGGPDRFGRALRIFCLVFACFHLVVVREAVYWMTGSTNYLWGTTLFLFCLLPAWAAERDQRLPRGLACAATALALAAGWMAEQSGLLLALFSLTLALTTRGRTGTWPRRPLLIAALAAAGFALIVLSPGHHERSGLSSFYELGLWEKLRFRFPHLLRDFTVRTGVRELTLLLFLAFAATLRTLDRRTHPRTAALRTLLGVALCGYVLLALPGAGLGHLQLPGATWAAHRTYIVPVTLLYLLGMGGLALYLFEGGRARRLELLLLLGGVGLSLGMMAMAGVAPPRTQFVALVALGLLLTGQVVNLSGSAPRLYRTAAVLLCALALLQTALLFRGYAGNAAVHRRNLAAVRAWSPVPGERPRLVLQHEPYPLYGSGGEFENSGDAGWMQAAFKNFYGLPQKTKIEFRP